MPGYTVKLAAGGLKLKQVSSWRFTAKAGIPVKQQNLFSYFQLIAAKTHLDVDGTNMA